MWCSIFPIQVHEQKPDFFEFSKFNQFQKINGAKYLPDCFHHPGDTNCFGNSTYPLDPDSDINESE